jgi:hypothetical protein
LGKVCTDLIFCKTVHSALSFKDPFLKVRFEILTIWQIASR